jgi:hypothetical protein
MSMAAMSRSLSTPKRLKCELLDELAMRSIIGLSGPGDCYQQGGARMITAWASTRRSSISAIQSPDGFRAWFGWQLHAGAPANAKAHPG